MASWISARVIVPCIVMATVLALVFLYLGINDLTNAHANTSLAPIDKCQMTVDELKKLIVKEEISIIVPARLPGSYYIQCVYMQDESRIMNASLFYHQSSQFDFTHIEQTKPAIAKFIGSGGIVISILREDILEDDPTFNNKLLHAESELILFATENPETELRYIDTNPTILTKNAQSSAAVNEIILYLDNNVILDISGSLSYHELLKIAESMLVE